MQGISWGRIGIYNLNNMISGGIAYRGFRQQTLGWENKTDMGYLYNGTLYVTNNVMWMFMPTARKPARRFCVFFFHFFAFDMLRGGGGSVITSCVFVVFDLLRWTHFMLRCTRLLYFGGHTSCYVAHVYCTSTLFDAYVFTLRDSVART